MTSTPTAAAQQAIDARRAELVVRYPGLWAEMVRRWRADEPADGVWLTYSANYLLRTGGVRWAVDPVTLRRRVTEAAPVDVANDLDGLSFVLLTHRHADHADPDLWRALAGHHIRWVVPEYLRRQFRQTTGLRSERVIVAQEGQRLELDGVGVTPLRGAHGRDDEGITGVPCTAYLVETRGGRMLFPGDLRTFRTHAFVGIEPVDTVFAHVWLGQGGALNCQPALTRPFCAFFLRLRPRRVFLTHLHELGRGPADAACSFRA